MAGEDSEKYLDLGRKEVQKHAWHMKRAIDNDNIKDVLQHAANMLYELRTGRLTPKHYYNLYMAVVDELHTLEDHFVTLNKKGTSMEELYRMVQHAGNVLPRLYLLVTAGSVYIRSKEAAATDILKDLVEMSKGVQHPMRGLFLRNYVSLRTKDTLPDSGNEYEGAGSTVTDSVDFIIQNFTEMNKLWVRMQFQRKHSKTKREKERRDLKVLVGTNLQRLSNLEGVTADVYRTSVLPRILEQVTNCKDAIAQYYLMDLIIHVFPSEYHLVTLQEYMASCANLKDDVDVRTLLANLMDRLADFASEEEIPQDIPVFKLFNENVAKVIQNKPKMALRDILGLQLSLLRFALRCATSREDKFTYADHILGFVADLLASVASGGKVDGDASQLVVDLLRTAVASLRLDVLQPEVKRFADLMGYLPWRPRKTAATQLLRYALDPSTDSTVLATPEMVDRLLGFLAPLTKDAEDMPQDVEKSAEEFEEEQRMMARLVHLLSSEDTDVQFQINLKARKHFGHGGTRRIKYTLVPLVFSTLQLAGKIYAREQAGEKPAVKCKKCFQFVHEIVTALAVDARGLSLRLFLQCAMRADSFKLHKIAYEFIAQSFILYEDMADSKSQIRAMNELTGALYTMTSFDEEDETNLVTRVTKYSAQLLKKPDQCRMVQLCCHLFWTNNKDYKKAYEDPGRVLECLQRSLKIADVCMGTSLHVQLFVEILNSYMYFFTSGCPTIKVKFLAGLIALIEANITNMESEDQGVQTFYQNTIAHFRRKQADPEFAEALKSLNLGSGD